MKYLEIFLDICGPLQISSESLEHPAALASSQKQRLLRVGLDHARRGLQIIKILGKDLGDLRHRGHPPDLPGPRKQLAVQPWHAGHAIYLEPVPVVCTTTAGHHARTWVGNGGIFQGRMVQQACDRKISPSAFYIKMGKLDLDHGRCSVSAGNKMSLWGELVGWRVRHNWREILSFSRRSSWCIMVLWRDSCPNYSK